jgi:uroporphyrinogen-III synthase
LKSQGFTVNRVVMYDAEPCELDGLAASLENVDGVLLYSPRTAKLWLKQVEKAGLAGTAAKLIHFCLSANVAAQLPKSWTIRVSETPNENGMLSLLDQAGQEE